MAELWPVLSLTPATWAALAGIMFLAGVVRGFTGFALSAFALALGVLILPPVQLIPVLWWLEVSASLAMLRGGWADADKRTALTLAIGSFTGMFIGLGLTTQLDPQVSRLMALCVLIALAALQLAKVRLGVFATPAGTVIAGVLAGIATGIAGIGGMVVALFVLAQERPPAQMRATMVLFLLLGASSSLLVHLTYGTMNATSTMRGLSFLLPCLFGVWIGTRLFTPQWQPYYKPICLWLLIGLGALSLVRTLI
ncbi:TSUP family transporter [Pseudaestuariivita sp.]|uniref:TSUP family transporter n=1 Tax=Pseudaestuariivita sp. TaxID=2211669 RepID=UPI004057CEEF